MSLSPNSVDASIRLHANECPFGPPAGVLREMQASVARLPWNRYPDAAADQFYRALSSKLDLPREMLLAGNGSDELISLLILAFGRKRRVFLPTPTFTMYRTSAQLLGALVQELRLTADYQLDVSLIRLAVGAEPGLLFLCSPNNPTGNRFAREDILRLAELPQLITVVDEAYVEFSGNSLIDALAQYPRLLILRTFSKAYGLAGIRLGYLIGNPALIAAVDRVRSPYNLNSLSLTVGRIALERSAELLAYVPMLLAERQWFSLQLSLLPEVAAYPSETNFLLLRLPCLGRTVCRELEQAGIRVRQLSDGLDDHLRVTVGARSENSRFLAALCSSLSKEGC